MSRLGRWRRRLDDLGHPVGKGDPFLGGLRHDLWALDWSPDGKRLAAGSYDRTVKIWEADTERELLTILHNSGVQSVAWSPDGKRLASGTRGQRVHIWDAATGGEVLTLQGHTGWVMSVAWSPDGTRLASAATDGTVRVWDPSREEGAVPLAPVGASFVVWSPDGKQLALGSERPGEIKILDAASSDTIRTLPSIRGPFAWSPDGSRLAAARDDHTVTIVDVLTGKQGLALDLGSGESRIRSAATMRIGWNPDGKRVAATFGDSNMIMVFDASTGQRTLSLVGHTGEVWAVKWSPDGKRLASASWDGTVKIWEGQTGKCLLTFRGHTPEQWIIAIAWSPDGARMASGGWDQTVKVWDTSSGGELLDLLGHTGSITSVAWTPDGNRLASASWDGSIKLWDPATGAELLSLSGHGGRRVDSLAWSPDGKRLASASAEGGTLKIWDAAPGYQFATSAAYRLERACRLREVKRYGDALDVFAGLTKESPHASEYLKETAYTYLRRGDAYLTENQLDSAMADFDQAIRLDPTSASAYRIRGSAYYNKGEYDRAIRDFDDVIRLDPNSADAYSNRAAAHRGKGDYDLAAADFSEVIRLKPDFALAYCQRAQARSQLGQIDDAMADLAKCLDLVPLLVEPEERNLVAWYLATPADARLRRPDQAEELAAKAVELRPADGDMWKTLGVAEYRARQLAGGTRGAREGDPARAAPRASDWFFLAMTYWQLGQEDEARGWYAKAVEWTAENRPWDENLKRFQAEAAELLGIRDES